MIPRYMLRRLAMPGGCRLEKLTPPVEVAGLCPTCTRAVLREKILGQSQVQGFYRNGEFYHYTCMPKPEQDWRRARNSGVVVLKGNLEPEEYRLWVGSREPYTTYAQCRCCKTSVYSTLDRQLHLKNEKFAVAGDRCSTRLIKAYKAMLEMSLCIVCKQSRYKNEKWGVPLCNRPECESEWKFGQQHWVALEHQLLQQVKKAEFLAREKDNAKSFIITAKDGVTTYDVWCLLCDMPISDAAHGEAHKLAALRARA